MDEILRIPALPEKSTAQAIENYGIAFRDVSFSYEADSQVKALSHVSFFADQGKVTAIVGPSGGGKSTIASLISRFYDVTDGSIQIGGVDIRDIPLDALMDKVSFVFQDTFLFKQSILDNIRMGNPGCYGGTGDCGGKGCKMPRIYRAASKRVSDCDWKHRRSSLRW